MLTVVQAQRFALEYIAAWNGRDLERVMAHWADDCVFTSPWIADLVGEIDGTVRGKAALEAYWSRAVELAPSIHFELHDVYIGHDSVVLAMTNHRGKSCAEWIQFGPDGLAVRGAAQYLGGRT